MGLRKNKLRDEHTDVDTGPLNDILFILLMFFLMISTLANSNVIKVGLAKGKSDAKQKQTVVVSIDRNTNIYVGSKQVIPDSLESMLRKYINEGDSVKPGVVINADTAAAWKGVVRVMRAARKLGATASASVTGSDK